MTPPDDQISGLAQPQQHRPEALEASAASVDRNGREHRLRISVTLDSRPIRRDTARHYRRVARRSDFLARRDIGSDEWLEPAGSNPAGTTWRQAFAVSAMMSANDSNDDLVIAGATDACCFSTFRAAGFSECPAFDWRVPLVAAWAAPPDRSVTGDGIMAVFGAPVALEDHAFRACLAALGVQEEARRLAVDVQDRDGVGLQLRVGLNSGEVIAGEIGSGPFGYTAVGEQVGMAQRMESGAPPGGVMLSASTARLVDGAAALGEPELVQIKGADEPVAAYWLLGIGDQHRAIKRAESNLVGRRWEMSAIEGLLDRAVDGHGAVVGVVGPPGIGKSRLVREVAARVGVSRQTVHSRLSRYLAEGVAGLVDRLRRPHGCPHRCSGDDEVVVVEMRRKHPCWGAKRIRMQLLKAGGEAVVPAERTTNRILSRHGLQDHRARKRRRESFKRWQRDAAMPFRLES
jgi:transposase